MKPKQGDKGLFWGTLAKLGIGLRSGWELRPSWNFCKSSGAILAPDPQSWTIAKSLSFHVFSYHANFHLFSWLELDGGQTWKKKEKSHLLPFKEYFRHKYEYFPWYKYEYFPWCIYEYFPWCKYEYLPWYKYEYFPWHIYEYFSRYRGI